MHATEVGGTHPALIEAMGQENLVVANGTPENAEVVGAAGILYRKNDPDDLARHLQEISDCPDKYGGVREAARQRASMVYYWDSVVSQYESLFQRLTRNKR